MARVPGTAGFGEVTERVRQRRGGTLRPLDMMLLHSPAVADGWNVLLDAVRTRLGLAASLRELLILRIAVLNRAEYEWVGHEPIARAAGVQQRQLAALREVRIAEDGTFTATELAALTYTDAMTLRVSVPDHVFDLLRPHFDEVAIIELTSVVAVYNMVSRFLLALGVEPPAAGFVG